MPECNKLGRDILLVDADDLDEALEIAVELVRPPLQVLISLEDTAVPTISHTAYKKMAATSPTPIILYAWSDELDFPQVCQSDFCAYVALSHPIPTPPPLSLYFAFVYSSRQQY
jgi:hypothetical protein